MALYTTYINKWVVYSVEHGWHYLNPTLPNVCRFLRTLADKGVKSGVINTARCALGTILPKFDGYPVGQHPNVCHIVKAVYEINPTGPRYSTFWNVNRVFSLFKEWGSNSKLTLKLLGMKLAVLCLLVTSQRGQTIMALKLSELSWEDGEAVFRLSTLLKHNRQGDPLNTVILRPFQMCEHLCVVSALKAYILRTKKLRKPESTQLLVSYIFPYKPISRDTLARWTVTVLRLAGLDTKKFKGHSTRGATASSATRMGCNINAIMKLAGWRCSTSFAKHYNKQLEIVPQDVTNRLLEGAL
jgi:integrase